MKLDRTLPVTWTLRGGDVPALADVASRATVVVVDDVEQLCASIVVDQSRSDAPYVPRETSDLYEALGFLLGRVVEVLPRYDPTRGRRVYDPWTQGFRAWLHDELVCDLIDQWRSWYGRNGHKRLPTTGRVNAEEADGREDPYDGRSGRERRSRGALTEASGDRGDAGSDALRGLLEGGDRQVLQQVEALGLGAAGRARGGPARADRDDDLVTAAREVEAELLDRAAELAA